MTRSSSRIRGRIRNTPLVKEDDPRRWREVSLFLCFLLLLVSPVLFDILQQGRYVRAGYEIERLTEEKKSLDQQHLRLRIERAHLGSLGPIAERAETELELVPARQGVRIIASAGTRAGR